MPDRGALNSVQVALEGLWCPSGMTLQDATQLTHCSRCLTLVSLDSKAWAFFMSVGDLRTLDLLRATSISVDLEQKVR